MKRTAFSGHDPVYINYMKSDKKYDMHVQHYHDTYEIYFQLEGKRYVFYDNICYTLERGDLIIFKPFELHYAESRDSKFFARYVLNFREDGLSKILTNEEKYLLLEKLVSCVVHLTETQTKTLYDYFKRTENFSKKTGPFSEKLMYSALFQLLVYIIECIEGEQIISGETVAPQIIAAIKYMNENYAHRLSLDDIAEAARMSKYHFSRRFKEVTGATVFEYLNNIRLTKVHNLLLKTEYTTEEIATATGFSSSVHLIRVFKDAYGITPKAFRRTQGNNVR